ncbi:reticulocyte-binding protein 3-like [Polistes fuscatus]|uniref:reticulocyte-binding protein 3-like n=1 Tax=Polistes fuscatus TaxID=30207 RepID=UPI001CA972CF|nr:reticulocyte-binding protein 3-like [Polistes fuscatus]
MCMHEVQEIVESGSKEFLNEKYDKALDNFKSALKILENSDSGDKENVQYMVQYLISITLLQLNKLQDLLEALEILINLEKSMESKYPIVYNGLAKAYIKLYRFNLALNEIKRGFDIINKGIDFETFSVPPTCIEKETTKDGLVLSLLELKEIASKWRYPDAKCALENCQNVIPHCPTSRDIYYRSERETSLKKLIELRKNYFGPLIDAEYQIDFENKKIDDANRFNRFLLEILYEYIKSETIVRKTKLISKWHETKSLFADVPSIQKLLDVNIINLLLKHTKLVMVGNYICIPEALGEVLQMFENEIIESYKTLTSEMLEIERAQSAINNVVSDYYNENEEECCSGSEERSPKEYLEVSDNSPDSFDKNSNTINQMNSDNNIKEDVRKRLSFAPPEEEYFVNNNNNYTTTDGSDYGAITVIDDKINDKTVYEKDEPNCVDLFVRKYFNNPLERFHPQNLSTILADILANEDITVEDKHSLLEELYFSVVQDTIKSSRKYMKEENLFKLQSKKIKQNGVKERMEVESETLQSKKVKDEQHYQLLLKLQDKQIKILKSERQQIIKIKQKLDNKINCLSDQLNAIFNDNRALKMENALKTLELQYCYNKLSLQEPYNYAHSTKVILTKVNNFIKTYYGWNINSDLNEWSSLLDETVNAIQELQLEFVRYKSWIESIKEDEKLPKINMKYIPEPKYPKKSCSSIISDIFTELLYKNATKLSQDLSTFLSILLSFPTSDISELIPPQLSTLKEFLFVKNTSEKIINEKKLIEAKNNVEKPQEIDLKQISETIDNFDRMLKSYNIEQLEAGNTQMEGALTNGTINNFNVLEKSNDNKPTSDAASTQIKDTPTNGIVNNINVLEKSNDNKLTSDTFDQILKLYDITPLEAENIRIKDALTNGTVNNFNVLEKCNDNKPTSDNFDRMSKSYIIKQLDAASTQIKVLEKSNDNKPTLSMPIKVASNLLIKREDSIDNKTHETNDTTIKDDNTNIERKNKENEIDPNDESMNSPLKNNNHHLENLNVKFDNNTSSLSHFLTSEFIQDLLKVKDNIKNIMRRRDEESLSTDSNSTELTIDSCTFI